MLTQIIINPIETPRGYKNPDHGIALRGPLSQFFSALYLKPLDDAYTAMKVTYLRFQDDVLILCHTKRQLERCKQRLMAVLKERQLRLSYKKTRMGSIDKGFHFLGIHYLGTQPRDNTIVTQTSDRAAIQANIEHNQSSLSGVGQVRQLLVNCLRRIVLSHMHGHYEKHVNRLNKWSLMRCLLDGSGVICITGPHGG